MSLAAAAAGADGLLIEAHNDPEHAVSDGTQPLPADQLGDLISKVSRIREAMR